MEHINLTKNLLKVKDPNVQSTKVIHLETHSEVLALLDYPAPNCPAYQAKMSKYDFQKPSKIPYLESVGYKTLIRLKKRRFQ
ncbi:transposase, partial [Streptococcus canis]